MNGIDRLSTVGIRVGVMALGLLLVAGAAPAMAQSAKTRYERALSREATLRQRLDSQEDLSAAERRRLLRDVARLVAAYDKKLDNAAFLYALLLIQIGDLETGKQVLPPILDTVGERLKRQPGKPFHNHLAVGNTHAIDDRSERRRRHGCPEHGQLVDIREVLSRCLEPNGIGASRIE